jgi:hypothetical protein
MIMRTLTISVAVLSLATSAALAASLTERLQSERMTVVKVDRVNQRFFCAEHHHWTRVSKTDVALMSSGDIVSVHRQGGPLPRVTVVRTAAEELASPER